MSSTISPGRQGGVASPDPSEPLRICVCTIAGHGVGGMQRHTHDLVRGLVAAGHDVEVICPAGGDLVEDLYGARWHLVDTRGRSDPEWRSKFRDTFLRADVLKPFDIVHSESTSAIGLLHPTVSTPIAIKYHGNWLGLAKAHVKRALSRPRTALSEGKTFVWDTRLHFRHGNAWVFRKCESMVVSKQQARDTAISHLIRGELMHVVPNGVDAERFSPGDRDRMRAELGLPGGILLASVGRLNREKGFDVAIAAVARLAPDHPDVRLLVIGDGEYEEQLRALTARLGVEELVLFVGPQDVDGVARHLQAADVFVFPTIRDEAIGLVLLEAMACGVPVVASRIGGIPEAVEPEGDLAAGLLIRPGSVAELESALRQLIADPQLRDDLGERARARVLDEYTIERMAARSADVYHVAIERRAAR
jgi:glycosyltransferase involved in cell wall biosynthesis